MTMRDSTTMYGAVSRVNHWAGALLVLVLLGLGLYFEQLPRGEERRFIRALHVAVGTLALPLLLFRVGWRLGSASPQPLLQARALMILSKAVHLLLLAGIAILAVTGPLSVWMEGRAFGIFDTLQFASPFAANKALGKSLETLHSWTANAMIGLIGLHVLAVLKHQLVDRDGLLARMTGRVQ